MRVLRLTKLSKNKSNLLFILLVCFLSYFARISRKKFIFYNYHFKITHNKVGYMVFCFTYRILLFLFCVLT